MPKTITLLDVTETTKGKIISAKNCGLDYPTNIEVEYFVDDVRFSLVESVKLKSKLIKFGFLPIGQKKAPRLPSIEIGTQVTVVYNSRNPAQAYIDGNQYKMNC